MAAQKKIEPTSAELEILNILWEKQPLTVREIHDKLSSTKHVGYTTTLKIMQNMTVKGLLKRELKGKGHLYITVYRKEETRQGLLNKLLNSAFGGSASSLVMQLLGNKKTSVKELEEIKKLIEELENNKQ
jgi:BlaI family penicillinase repressor